MVHVMFTHPLSCQAASLQAGRKLVPRNLCCWAQFLRQNDKGLLGSHFKRNVHSCH